MRWTVRLAATLSLTRILAADNELVAGPVVPLDDVPSPVQDLGALNQTQGIGWSAVGTQGPTLSESSTCSGSSQDPFAYHEAYWPPNARAVATLLVASAGLLIAAGGGIGGGGILVPLYMIFLEFRPKHAIALSNFTIFGGAIANTYFNVQKSNVAGVGSLIDWDIIIMMEPSTIAGAVIGSFASKYLPDFVLTVALAIVLALLSYRTLDKGIKMYRKESEDFNRQEAESPTEEDEDDDEEKPAEFETLIPGDHVPARDHSLPWSKILLLVLCFVGCVILTILKGSSHGSIIGVECGSWPFWILSLASVPWVIGFGVLFRNMLIAENEAREQASSKSDASRIRWDAETTITYPLLCTIAGIAAGLFGVGGGIVKGPLMLEMGVNPLVAAATAATMILFTSAAACVSFEVFGLLEPRYAALCFFLGIGCTAIGQGAINVWMKAARRHSPPVLSIGAVMAMSTFLIVIEAYAKVTSKTMDELMQPSPLCNRCD